MDPNWANRCARPRTATPLEQILVDGSTYNRGKLKQRLYDEGLKQRRCEMCGQGEEWRGQPMSLILDHINGYPTDNRLENLRIVCPNCAATLETHCGRKNRLDVSRRSCLVCGAEFTPKYRVTSLLLADVRVPQPRTPRSAAGSPEGVAVPRTSSWWLTSIR